MASDGIAADQSSDWSWPDVTAVTIAAAFAALAIIFYWPGLNAAYASWQREEYSYGYIVPVLAAFLFVKYLPSALRTTGPEGRSLGLVICAIAVLLGIVGSLSRIADLSGYGFLLALAGGLIVAFGRRAAFGLWVPVVYLAFMFPLPQVIYLKMSSAMQLVSSEIGVGLLRLIEIPVLLEGNVIDLGSYKLQVAEACSGLRYLFPLLSFGFLFAVLYRGPTWQKWALFLSAVPITILMNSLRIAVIGILVIHFGEGMAEGFLHFFQGWVIFLGCVALLFAEAFVFWRALHPKVPLAQAVDLRLGALPDGAALRERLRLAPLVFVTALLAAGLLVVQFMGAGAANVVPPRSELIDFPSMVDGWKGERTALPPDVLQVLGADDYVYATYKEPDRNAVGSGIKTGPSINLFIAYYADQTDGRAVHSPEVCLPGDGWEVRSFGAVPVKTAARPAGFQVNRAIVQKGLSRALVYYWFEERGRTITNEYWAKWYILADGMTRNRTDGGLVRLVTPLGDEEEEAAADQRLRKFLNDLTPRLGPFLPH